METKSRCKFACFVISAMMVTQVGFTNAPAVTESTKVSILAANTMETPIAVLTEANIDTTLPVTNTGEEKGITVTQGGAPVAGFSTTLDTSTTDEITAAIAAEGKPGVSEEFVGVVLANVDEYLNIRQEPSAEAEVVGMLKRGAAGKILETTDTWTKISSGEVEGWVSNDYIVAEAEAEAMAGELITIYATVNVDGLRVRAEANPTAEGLATVSSEEKYQVIEMPQVTDEEAADVSNEETTNSEDNSEKTINSEDTSQATAEETSGVEEEMSSAAEASAETSGEQTEADNVSEEDLNDPAKWVKIKCLSVEGYVFSGYVEINYTMEQAMTIEEYNEMKAQEERERIAQEEKERAEQAAAAAAAVQQSQGGTESRASTSASYDDAYLLAAMCQVEAGGSYEGMLAVANVIINRVNSGSYPGSISGVIYQSGQFATGGRFQSILASGPSGSAMNAANAALAGENNVGGYLSFNAASSVDPGSFSSYVIIGGNCFYAR